MTAPAFSSAKAVIVHSLAEALAAAEAADELGRPLAVEGTLAAGIGWLCGILDILAERHPGLVLTGALDCADQAGTVQGALRRGIRRLRFTGPETARARLAELALSQGGEVTAKLWPALDLSAAPDLGAACRAWLAAPSSSSENQETAPAETGGVP